MIDYPALLTVAAGITAGVVVYRWGRSDGRQDGYDIGFAVGSKQLSDGRIRQPIVLPPTTTVNHYHLEAPKPVRDSKGQFTKPSQSQ